MRPPYVCCILHCPSSTPSNPLLLLEHRPMSRPGLPPIRLNCFGGKLEAHDTSPESGLLRELNEELNWQPNCAPTRAVDLYVDNELIAYFYSSADASPSTDFTYESDRGRHGEWMHLDDALKDERTSKWHKSVLEVWKSGGYRADYVTPPENT